MDNVSVIVKMTAQPGKRDALIEALRPALEAAHDEPGTVVFVLQTDSRDPDSVLLYELYTDQSALDAHAAAPSFKAAQEAIAGLLAGHPEMSFLRPVAGKGLAD